MIDNSLETEEYWRLFEVVVDIVEIYAVVVVVVVDYGQ